MLCERGEMAQKRAGKFDAALHQWTLREEFLPNLVLGADRLPRVSNLDSVLVSSTPCNFSVSGTGRLIIGSTSGSDLEGFPGAGSTDRAARAF